LGGSGGGASPATFTEESTASVSFDEGVVEVEVTNTGVREGDTTAELFRYGEVIDSVTVRSLPGYMSETVSLSYGSEEGEYEVTVDDEVMETFTVEGEVEDTDEEVAENEGVDDVEAEEETDGVDDTDETEDAVGVDEVEDEEADDTEEMPGFTIVLALVALTMLVAHRLRS